jgi:hypothetical protein
VVFPTASSTSVRSRTSFGSPLISAIPPALSAMGPKASMASCMAVVAIIPAAAMATPYTPANSYEAMIPPASTRMGRVVLSIPTASPPITLVAWPVDDCRTMELTGRRPMAV